MIAQFFSEVVQSIARKSSLASWTKYNRTVIDECESSNDFSVLMEMEMAMAKQLPHIESHLMCWCNLLHYDGSLNAEEHRN